MSHGASGVSLFTYTVPYIMGELMLGILSHIPWVSSQVSQGYGRVLYVILVGIYIVAAAIGPHFEHKKAEISGQPAANPQPTRKQPATIGPHFGDKKTGIHGQPTANPQLLVQILGTKKRESMANPQLLVRILGTKKWESIANPQLLVCILGTKKRKSMANPQPTRNYWFTF
jgi:hypothetical protein